MSKTSSTAVAHGASPQPRGHPVKYRSWGSGLTRLDARETMARMRDAVRESLFKPIVIHTPRGLIARLPERDEVAQVLAIRAWCKQHFRFVKDPIGYEWLEAPDYSLWRIHDEGFVQGDCDDAAQLTAALAMSIGHRCRFYSVARSPDGAFRHVFTVCYPRDRVAGREVPVEMDITRPPEIPRLPQFARRIALDV